MDGGPTLQAAPSALTATGPGPAPIPEDYARDPEYDALTSCAPSDPRQTRASSGTPQWVFEEDVGEQVKYCTLTVTPLLPPGVPWGPVASYNWNGDFGYWFDAPGVGGGCRWCGVRGTGSQRGGGAGSPSPPLRTHLRGLHDMTSVAASFCLGNPDPPSSSFP